MTQNFARPEWRAFFVGAASLIGVATAATPSHAQFRASWDANAAVSEFDVRADVGALSINPDSKRRTTRWLEQRALGAAFQFDRPLLQLKADGVLRAGDVVGNATGGVSALLATPTFGGVRFSASYDARHVPNDGSSTYTRDSTLLALWVPIAKPPSWRSNTSATVSYARNATGVWFQATDRQGANRSDSLSSLFIASGLMHQLRSVVIGFSLGTQGVLQSRAAELIYGEDPDGPNGPDTARVEGVRPASTEWRRWSEASLTVGWARHRFAFDGSVNTRPRLGTNRSATWGAVSGTAAVSSRMALVGSVRTTPPLPGVLADARRVATLGMRIASPAFWRPAAPTPVRATSRAFDVQQAGPGQYLFVLSVPNARTVELAGDFTAWQSVKLRQINATRWEVLVEMAPGAHRCNVRIDGADWVPPPGVPTIKDDFNGRVGLFVAD